MLDYTFHNLGRIGQDKEDNSQRTVQNTRFANATVANYFSETNTTLENTVKFATSQPTMTTSGTVKGKGLNGQMVDIESILMLKIEQERPLEKLSLQPRPFLTVPYLGKGIYQPHVESGLRRGDMIWEPKGESTIMDKSFMNYHLPPDYESNDIPEVEEMAMNGWIRGGISSRILT
jgi:hypothetical protein